MPQNVPVPEECELEEIKWERLLRTKGSTWSSKGRKASEEYIFERRHSGMAIIEVPKMINGKEFLKKNERMLWMKARDEKVLDQDNGMQKVREVVWRFPP